MKQKKNYYWLEKLISTNSPATLKPKPTESTQQQQKQKKFEVDSREIVNRR